MLAGTHAPREFSRLVVAARVHLQDESILDPGVIAVTAPNSQPPAAAGIPSVPGGQQPGGQKTTDLAALLPTTARLLLLSAYLAAHNAAKHDLALFSTHHHGRRRRRGGMLGSSRQRGRHRKISRKLLPAHAFPLERMQAIFVTVKGEWAASSGAANTGPDAGLDSDVGMAIATLSSLRLLVKVGAGRRSHGSCRKVESNGWLGSCPGPGEEYGC